MNRIDKLIKALFSAEKLETSTLDDGSVIEYTELIVGEVIYIVVEEDKMIIPDGEYTIEGKMITIENGIISEIKEEEVQPDAESEAEAVPEEEFSVEKAETEEEKVLSLQEETDIEFTTLRNRVNELQNNISDLLTKLNEKFVKDDETIGNLSKTKEDLEAFIVKEIEDFKNETNGVPVQKLNKIKIDEDKKSTFSRLGDFYNSQK